MAPSPVWNVYNHDGEYLASCRFAVIAAAIIGAVGGEGWTIRYGHRKIVFTQGKDAADAFDSIDAAANTALRNAGFEVSHG